MLGLNRIITKVAAVGCLVIAGVVGYSIGDKACERKITKGLERIYSSDPELEARMFEHLEKYKKEKK